MITGEGGSGGALAIAVGDVVLALDNAVYRSSRPEGCAWILWRTPSWRPQAAVAMRMTAAEQQALGVVDLVVAEPAGGAHTDHAATARRAAAIDRRASSMRSSAVPLADAARGALPALPAPRRVHRSSASGTMGPQERPGLGDRLRQLLDAGRAVDRAREDARPPRPAGATT